MTTAILEEKAPAEGAKAGELFADIDVLVVQDGGCAPGYNPVTAFITAHMERFNRRCYAAHEGFKSLVSNEDADYRRIIYNREVYKQEEHVPGVLNVSSLSDASGARFRCERYPQFAKRENVKRAAMNLLGRHVNVVVVAEGYKRDQRPKDINTAEFFYRELTNTGKQLRLKVVREAFSRDLRGAQPNSQDVSLAQRMAHNVVEYMRQGQSAVMPAVGGLQDFPLPFDVIQTDNTVPGNLVKVANRLFL